MISWSHTSAVEIPCAYIVYGTYVYSYTYVCTCILRYNDLFTEINVSFCIYSILS